MKPLINPGIKGVRNYPRDCRCGMTFKRILYRRAGLMIDYCPSGRFQRNIPYRKEIE